MKLFGKSRVLLALMLIMVMTMAVSGCQKAETSKTPAEPVTLEFSYPPYGYDYDKEMEFWQKHIAAFQAANPNIKINFTVESWDNVYTKWEQALETGQTPDIGYDCPITAVDYALQKKILPVTDLVNQLGGDAAFNEGMLDFKSGGEWYGVPHGDASQILLYRKDILKAAGFDNPPKNWDELVTIAKATNKNGVKGIGFFTGDDYQSSQILTGLMAATGGVMVDKDGKVALNSPENLKALQLVDQLYNKLKVVPESTLAWEHSDPANAIGLGKVAMAITWGGYGTLLPSMFPDTYQNIGYAKLPDGPSGHSGSWSGTGGFFIFKDAKHPEEAKKFIAYMSQPALSKEWALVSGNVSPFVSITNDPELTKLEWYKAMQEQSATQITLGWGHDIILGDYMCDPLFTEAMVNVTVNKKSPEEALKILQENVEKTIKEANAK